MKIAVVGRGLIGSAAARHLALMGHDVTLIGPSEPQHKATHQGVFASHYDEGRITRKNDPSPFWAKAAAASIARYHEIEAASGIRFFTESGALMAGPSNWISKVRQTRETIGFEAIDLSPEDLAARFDYFDFPADISGSYEPREAGHVSPRRLVAAQSEAARRAGADIIDAEVQAVAPGHIKTATEEIRADEVIVATGGWTDTLLARDPKYRVFARTVAFFEIDETTAAELSEMPSMVYDAPGDPYLLPPIRYPDGKIYLKLGGDPENVQLGSAKEIGDWFRSGGSPTVRDWLEALFRELMPGVAIKSTSMTACVTSWTDDGLPEIHRLAPRFVIAAGGNGAGAKCSDELGRRAAMIAVRESEV